MTAIIGITCSEGVIIGADKLATSYITDIGETHHQISKITKFEAANVVTTGAGLIMITNRYNQIIEEILEQDEGIIDNPRNFINKIIAEARIEFKHTDEIDEHELIIAFVANGKRYLYRIWQDFEPEPIMDPPFFVVGGSADKYLAIFMEQILFFLQQQGTMLDIDQGQLAALWAIENTNAVASGNFRGIEVAILEQLDGNWEIYDPPKEYSQLNLSSAIGINEVLTSLLRDISETRGPVKTPKYKTS